MRTRFVSALTAVVFCILVSTSARAVVNGTWAGTANPWSTVGSTGWTNGTVPNGVGDTATDSQNNGSITQHIDVSGGVTVGNITANWAGTMNTSWQITPDTPLTMSQDGFGAGNTGSASIINDAHSTATGNCSIFINSSTGAFTMADDLFLSNTSNSTRGSGAIQMRAKINGVGNIWTENIKDDLTAPISFQNSGAFSGTTTIAKGAAVFSHSDAFTPTPSATLTIGATGEGSAMLMWNAGGGMGAMENNIIIAANSGGTLQLGVASNPTAPVQIKSSNTGSSIRLDGDLILSNLSSQLFTIGDPMTGVGKVTKTGTGALRVLESNTYQGGTIVDGGSMAVGNSPPVDNGFGHYNASFGKLGTGDVSVTSNATFLEIESDVVDAIADSANVNLAGGGAAGVADNGYMKLDGAVNEIVHTLILGGAGMSPGTYGSSASSASFKNDEYFSGTGMLTVTADLPEPASLSLFGIAALTLLRRRRR